MRIVKSLVLTIAILYEISRRAFELAGDSPDMKLEKEPKTPKGKGKLRQEFGDRLPAEVYSIFGRGVAYHRRKQYANALAEYKKLRRIPLQGGRSYDLYFHSKVFLYNWRLLSKAMKRQ